MDIPDAPPTKWVCRFAVASAAATAIIPALRRFSDPDLPWHLAVGRAAVAAKGLLKADTFSYTQAGRHVPYEYLSELSLYAAHRLAGPWGLHLLMASAVTLLAWLMVLRPGKEARLFGLVFCALALAALSPFLILRPALLGFPFFAAELLCIERYRETGETRWLWLLVPLQLLWANVHAFAVIGAALAVAAAALLPKRGGRLQPALAAAASVAMTCLSSFGPGIFLGPWRVAGHTPFLAEWAPASFGLFWRYDPALGLLVALVMAALIRGGALEEHRHPPLFDSLMLLSTFALMLTRFRLAPFFIIAAAPLAAQRLWPLLRGSRWMSAAVLSASLIAPAAAAMRHEAPWGVGFDTGRQPEAAARFIEEHKPQGPLFNNIAFGGYLIWRLFPNVKVFIDGRTAYLYPPGFLSAAWQAEFQPEIFERLSSNHHFEWAVVDARYGASFARPVAQSKDWAMVYLDDVAAVYVRAAGPNSKMAQSGYQGLRHLSPWPILLEDGLPLGVLSHDADLALAQAPNSTRANLWTAALAIRRGDLTAAQKYRDRAAALSPRNPGLLLLDRFIRGLKHS